MISQILAIFILLFFYGIYIGKMLAQHKRGIQTDQMTRKKTGALFYIELLLKLSTYTVVLIEVLSILLCTTVFPPVFRILGFSIAVLGDVIFALAVWTMRDSWRAGIAQQEKTEMVTSGIYRLSRNPAFLGFNLVYLGILIMFFNWILCAVTLLSMVMLHLQILQEEKHLSLVFGEDYGNYKHHVGRYLWKL